jgi:hypothetical protein
MPWITVGSRTDLRSVQITHVKLQHNHIFVALSSRRRSTWNVGMFGCVDVI